MDFGGGREGEGAREKRSRRSLAPSFSARPFLRLLFVHTREIFALFFILQLRFGRGQGGRRSQDEENRQTQRKEETNREKKKAKVEFCRCPRFSFMFVCPGAHETAVV